MAKGVAPVRAPPAKSPFCVHLLLAVSYSQKSAKSPLLLAVVEPSPKPIYPLPLKLKPTANLRGLTTKVGLCAQGYRVIFPKIISKIAHRSCTKVAVVSDAESHRSRSGLLPIRSIPSQIAFVKPGAWLSHQEQDIAAEDKAEYRYLFIGGVLELSI